VFLNHLTNKRCYFHGFTKLLAEEMWLASSVKSYLSKKRPLVVSAWISLIPNHAEILKRK